MDSIEVVAKTVEEAIEKALEQLNVTRDNIKITVLKEGKTGILGIGSEEAKILVEPFEETQQENAAMRIKVILEEILRLTGFNASVEMEEPLVALEPGEAPVFTFNITGDDDIGILIGRHGQTIASLQYLIRVLVSHQIENPPQIIIDIDGYKKRRYEALQATARRLAEQVKMKRAPFTMEPMPAFERRIIHMTLAKDSSVTTQSIGEGESRKVVISLKSGSRMSRPPVINR
jgi:spoIIIJ-associated protein